MPGLITSRIRLPQVQAGPVLEVSPFQRSVFVICSAKDIDNIGEK